MDMKNLPITVEPNLVVSPHPLSATHGRRLIFEGIQPGESLYDYLSRLSMVPIIPDNFIISVNGNAVDFSEIDRVFPKPNDLIVIRARVHGGGDSGGSDPVRIALVIAVLVVSQGAASVWVGSMLGTSAAVGSAIIAVGGMLLISALIPVKVPSFTQSSPSPTYSLSGSANRARLFEPLQLIFGTLRVYPDHGAKPYSEFEGRDQNLIQIFNYGLSDITLSDHKIGDSLVTNFDGVVIEESIGDTGDITTYPTNVDMVAGGDLVDNAGVFIVRTSSADTTKLTIDIAGLSYYVDPEHGLASASITIFAEWRPVAGGAWFPFFRQPLGAPLPYLNEKRIINGDKETLRLSYSRPVSTGQYEVRVMLQDSADWYTTSIQCDENGENCTSNEFFNPRGLNQGGMTQVLSWNVLKSFQPDTGDYTGQKRLALEIKASGQLNGRVDTFNSIASAKVLVWNNPVWTLEASSNPAWEFLSLARGKFDASGRRMYGAGLPDASINIEQLKLWGAWCDSKSLTCDIIFDGKMSVIDMLNTIARCGRAAATWSNGTLGVVYDEANKPATSVFSMSNIVRDTFNVNYITRNQVEEVVVAFNNAALGYVRDTVRTVVPGIIAPVNTVSIDLPGVLTEAQAAKEANLIAAEQVFRRRIITFESDIEGLATARGEVAILSHDLTLWDYSGRLVSGTTTTLVLDRPVTFTPAESHFIGVKFPDGTYEVVDVPILVGDHTVIGLGTPLSSSPDADLDNIPMDYMWVFGPAATPGKQVKVTDITPINENRVRITVTDEEDDFYLAESNTYTYIPPTAYLANLPTISGLTLGESLVIVGSGFGSKVNVSWDVLGEYGGAFIRAKSTNTEYRDVGRTLDKTFSFEWPTGDTVTVEVVTYNLSFESTDVSRDTASLLLVGKMALPSDVTNFSALQNGAAVVIRWLPPPDIDLAGTEIRYGVRGASNWADATPLTQVTKGTNITSQALPDGDWTLYAKHRDTSLNYSLNAAESDVLFSTDNDIIMEHESSPDFENVDKNIFIDDQSGAWVSFPSSAYPINSALAYTFNANIRADKVGRATRFILLRIQFSGNTLEFHDLNLDTSTGEHSDTLITAVSVTLVDGYWNVSFAGTSTDSLNTHVAFYFYPAVGASATWVQTAAAIGSSIMYDAQGYEEGSTTNMLLGAVNLNPPTSVNFVLHHTGKLVPSSIGDTLVLGFDVFDTVIPNPHVYCAYESIESDIGFDDTVRIWGDIQSFLIDGIGVANPQIQIDYRVAAEPYDGFEPWGIGNALCRYVKQKLVLDTTEGLAIITGFQQVIDLLERTYNQPVTVSAGGSTIVFDSPFHLVPWGSASVNTVGSGKAAYATITSITPTQGYVEVFNTAGVSAGGTATITLTGV